MFATFFTVALFAVSALTGVVADDEINFPTPAIKQCTPIQLTWGTGAAPYRLIAVPAADPCGDLISDLGDHNGTSMTWTPALKAGTKIMLSLEDKDGVEGWTGAITIGDGPDDCLSNKLVAPSVPVAVANPAAAAPSATDGAASIVGGVSGNGPLEGSTSGRQINMSLMVLTAIAAFALF